MNFKKEIARWQIAGLGGLKIVTTDEETCLLQLREVLKGDLFFRSSSTDWCKLFKNNTIREDIFEDDDYDEERSPFSILLDKIRAKKINSFQTFVFCGVDTALEQDSVGRRAFLECYRVAKEKKALVIILSRKQPEDLQEIPTFYHPLPTHEETKEILQEQLKGTSLHFESEESALSTLQGLTLTQQKDAVALAQAEALLEKCKKLSLDVLRAYKENEIGKTGFLQIVEPVKTFDDIKGHSFLKKWLGHTKKAFSKEAQKQGVALPKGVLLAGPPGTGKSRIAEALAKDWSVPLLSLDVGSLFSKWQGETESQMREALQIAEHLSPCVLLIDEVERFFSQSGNQNDGGTSERITGKLLSWLATKESHVFVVFTANFAQRLPAAMIRKGRIDDVFFVGYPYKEELGEIIDYYKDRNGIEADTKRLKPLLSNHSPAEIEAIMAGVKRIAFAEERDPTEEDVILEVKGSLPVYESMKSEVLEMLRWSETNARSSVTGLRK